MGDARSSRRTPGGRRSSRSSARGAQDGRGRRGAVATAAAPARPRFTGRALILLLVLAALVASYASSLRAYVDQRSHIGSLESRIEDSRAAIEELQREKKRWGDDAYVVAQARARFAFGFPGEIGYQVLDEEGRPLGHEDSLSTPEPVQVDRPEWWERTVDSVEVAGHPPRADEGPAERITTPPDLRSPEE